MNNKNGRRLAVTCLVATLLFACGVDAERSSQRTGAVKAASADATRFDLVDQASLLDPEVFNARDYAGLYPDLGDGVESLQDHWLRSGAAEGRSGSLVFSAVEYLAQYPDLGEAGIVSPLAAIQHFVTVGRAEGRAGRHCLHHDVFDPVFYKSRYFSGVTPAPTLLAMKEHYMQHGVPVGARAAWGFSPDEYLTFHPVPTDWPGKYLYACSHYILHGRAGGTMAAPNLGFGPLQLNQTQILPGAASGQTSRSPVVPIAGVDFKEMFSANYGAVHVGPVSVVVRAPHPDVENVHDVPPLPAGHDAYVYFRDALVDARLNKYSKLRFPAARYVFLTDPKDVGAASHVDISQMHDIEIDGSGSTLVFKGLQSHGIRITRSQRVVIKNFELGWDQRMASLGTVIKSGDNDAALAFFDALAVTPTAGRKSWRGAATVVCRRTVAGPGSTCSIASPTKELLSLSGTGAAKMYDKLRTHETGDAGGIRTKSLAGDYAISCLPDAMPDGGPGVSCNITDTAMTDQSAARRLWLGGNVLAIDQATNPIDADGYTNGYTNKIASVHEYGTPDRPWKKESSYDYAGLSQVAYWGKVRRGSFDYHQFSFDGVDRLPLYKTFVARHLGSGYAAVYLFHPETEDVTLDNVNVTSSPGFGFMISSFGRGLHLMNSAIKRDLARPDSIISTSADGIHIAGTHGDLVFENLDIGYQGDDGLNLLQEYIPFKKTAPRTITVDKAGVLAYGAQTPLAFFDRSSRLVATGIVTDDLVDGTVHHITLSTDLDLSPDSLYAFADLSQTGRFIIRGCRFHDNRGRGMLIRSDNGLIEGNRVSRTTMNALIVGTSIGLPGQDKQYEGYSASNLLIRNNVFEETNFNLAQRTRPTSTDLGAVTFGGLSPAGVPQLPVSRNVIFQNNTIQNTPGIGLYISAASNVAVLGNAVLDTNLRPFNGHEGASMDTPARGAVMVSRSSRIDIVNRPGNSPVVYKSPLTTQLINVVSP